MPLSTGKGEVEIGGVIYADSADKAARFILECNHIGTPLLFLQDVMGFMVGKAAEASGIIKSGAKMVNAISNSIVPKITIILGNSFGAGHYALCGKAYDPTFILAWPSAKYAVMGAEQARETLQAVQTKAAEKGGKAVDHDTLQEMQNGYARQMDIRYGAARGWVDAIIDPAKTRSILRQLLPLAMRSKKREQSFHTGVIQL
jgi:acetyl-CoA carboxylase carboxyltransferase component